LLLAEAVRFTQFNLLSAKQNQYFLLYLNSVLKVSDAILSDLAESNGSGELFFSQAYLAFLLLDRQFALVLLVIQQ
jgi:hypothetical protein